MPENGPPRKHRLPYGELTRLAQRVGRTPGHLSRVITGERRSQALRQLIEREVGVPVDAIEVSRRREAEDERQHAAAGAAC